MRQQLTATLPESRAPQPLALIDPSASERHWFREDTPVSVLAQAQHKRIPVNGNVMHRMTLYEKKDAPFAG
ncbi:hypothetical protein PHSY_000639 [Pseudozyma hubeiensis SY62]|uniref:Uncharacterized protein n=1 Tax=Pseudozyma hubeiensis (strain SY62) TaxID=1305764 RepID=R9NWS7_PSEHS|nr:hypothetical protein PHSY_000639 [Pseudozyma hubeiensis SY62]GAC93078.1 hypothetical protein PHSY_000639 [Pseudozyma hubeiensis SY62]